MGTDIRNIVVGAPDGPRVDGRLEGPPRELALFYAELLGWRIVREDWLVIAEDEHSSPRLAFDELPDYRPPSWPDPERPQQVHLDVTVDDLDAADASVLRLGATRFQDKGEYRSYTDPAGHPFCLYRGDAGAGDRAGSGLPGRLDRIVFDCFSPRSLAAFYSDLLGMYSRTLDTPDRVVIARDDGTGLMLGFQHAPMYKAPRWPDPAHPQHIHLDLDVEDGPAAQELAERLGAIRLPNMGGSCPVYADPAAHPFCLCAPDQ
jgi:hypothetical protein